MTVRYVSIKHGGQTATMGDDWKRVMRDAVSCVRVEREVIGDDI